MAEHGPTMRLAQRLTGTHYQELPPQVVELAKQCIIDFIGVTIAGADEPLVQLLRTDQAETGGQAQATLIGGGGRVSADQAALINGSSGHAHDYDDVNSAMFGHPTIPVAPAAMALAEYLEKSGLDLIQAFAKGVDAECLAGRFIGPSHYGRGWHATGTLGALGAAAASASLYSLSAEATAQAIGIAATQAAGLKSQFGTMCKPLHAGHAAATGLVSARLASRGFTSRTDMLETEQGLAATQSDAPNPEAFARSLSEETFLTGTCFKYHAACYLTHSSIEAMRELIAQHHLGPEDVRGIEITVNQGHFGVCNIQSPSTGLEAKFSLKFTAAMVLAGIDTSSIDVFTDQLTQRKDLIDISNRVKVIAWPEPRAETRVVVETAYGALSSEKNVGIPSTDLPGQRRKLEAKFHALVDPRLGAEAANEILAICDSLENVKSLNRLMQLLGGQMNV